MRIALLDPVELGVTVSLMILGVVLVRQLFRRSHGRLLCIVWGLVALRLLVPLSIQGDFGFITKIDMGKLYEAEHIFGDKTPSMEMPPSEQIPIVGESEILIPGLPEDEVSPVPENPKNDEAFVPDGSASDNPITDSETVSHGSGISFNDVFPWVRFAGTAALLLWGITGYIKVKRRAVICERAEGNVRLCDDVSTPFILGLIRPRIILPSNIKTEYAKYALLHEREHLRWGDHLWRPMGFVLLAIYWYNPLVWVAYMLFCRDTEYACDEAVLSELSGEERRAYGRVLLDLSVGGTNFAGCPVAFGEVCVKGRIKSVVAYRRPKLWATVVAAILAAVITMLSFVGCASEKEDYAYSEYDGVSLEVVDAEYGLFDASITVKFTNESDNDILCGEEYRIYRKTSGGYADCSLLDDRYYSEKKQSIAKGSDIAVEYILEGYEMVWNETYLFETKVFEGDKSYRVCTEFRTPKSTTGKSVIESAGSGYYVRKALESDGSGSPIYTEDGVSIGEIRHYRKLDIPTHISGVVGRIPREPTYFSFTELEGGDVYLYHSGGQFTLNPTEITADDFEKKDIIGAMLEHNNRTWLGNGYILFEQKTGNLYLGTYYTNFSEDEPDGKMSMGSVVPVENSIAIREERLHSYDRSGFYGVVTGVTEENIVIRPADEETVTSMTDRVTIPRREEYSGTTDEYSEGDRVRVDIKGGMLIKTDSDGNKTCTPQRVEEMYLVDGRNNVGFGTTTQGVRVKMSADKSIYPVGKTEEYNGKAPLTMWQMDSVAELGAFVDKYNEDMGLSIRRENSDSFKNKVILCDEEFFENGRLYVIYVSSDARHDYAVDTLVQKDGVLEIPVSKIDPKVGDGMPLHAHLLVVKVPDVAALGDITSAVAYLK